MGVQMASDGAFTAGTLLGGRFELHGVVGRGGTGTVMLATDWLRSERVALRIVHPHLAADPATADVLQREVQSASVLHSEAALVPNDLHEADGVLALSMPFHPGQTLTERIATSGPMPHPDVRALGIRIGTALAEAHRVGLLHRDVTANNVLVGDRPNDAVLTDFGLSRIVGHTRSTALLGTAGYAAPEVYAGERANPRSDLYGLGAVLYLAVTGRPPFDPDTPMVALKQQIDESHPGVRALRPDCPADLADTIERLLRADPAKRPQGARDVVDALERREATGAEPRPVARGSSSDSEVSTCRPGRSRCGSGSAPRTVDGGSACVGCPRARCPPPRTRSRAGDATSSGGSATRSGCPRRRPRAPRIGCCTPSPTRPASLLRRSCRARSCCRAGSAWWTRPIGPPRAGWRTRRRRSASGRRSLPIDIRAISMRQVWTWYTVAVTLGWSLLPFLQPHLGYGYFATVFAITVGVPILAQQVEPRRPPGLDSAGIAFRADLRGALRSGVAPVPRFPTEAAPVAAPVVGRPSPRHGAPERRSVVLKRRADRRWTRSTPRRPRRSPGHRPERSPVHRPRPPGAGEGPRRRTSIGSSPRRGPPRRRADRDAPVPPGSARHLGPGRREPRTRRAGAAPAGARGARGEPGGGRAAGGAARGEHRAAVGDREHRVPGPAGAAVATGAAVGAPSS